MGDRIQPSDWYDYIKNHVGTALGWEESNSEFVSFFDEFRREIIDTSVLLIGTGSTELMFTEWPRILKSFGAKSITYLEIYEGYREKFANREYKIIEGDITEIDKYITEGAFDFICWFHGPEHIKYGKMPDTFNKIKLLCNKGLVTICPYGSYYDETELPQGNVYEAHLQPNMSVETFNNVSSDISFFSIGQKDASDAVIFGYYFKEEANG